MRAMPIAGHGPRGLRRPRRRVLPGVRAGEHPGAAAGGEAGGAREGRRRQREAGRAGARGRGGSQEDGARFRDDAAGT